MATTALAILQDVRECRWSREVERAWICLREGSPRAIATEECRTCSQWERPAGFIAANAAAGIALTGDTTAALVLSVSVRATLLLTAVFFATLGFVTLAEPLSVPFTVVLWLCAAAFAGLAVFWNPPAG